MDSKKRKNAHEADSRPKQTSTSTHNKATWMGSVWSVGLMHSSTPHALARSNLDGLTSMPKICARLAVQHHNNTTPPLFVTSQRQRWLYSIMDAKHTTRSQAHVDISVS